MADLPKSLAEGAARQHGLISRVAAKEAGVDARRLQRLVARSVLEPVGTRAFRVVGAPETPKQRVLAACLDVAGVATTTTASAQHGLSGFALEPPEVLVVDRRRLASSELAVVRRTTYLPPEHVVVIDGIPTLNVARTLFSLAAIVPEITERRVEEAIEDAMRKGLAREPWLRWMLDLLRRPGRNGVAVFERALDRACGLPVTDSWLETEALRILAEAGLPLPETQVRVTADEDFVARVDFAYPGIPAVIEVNGDGTHSTRRQMANDASRRRKLAALGLHVYDFTYDEIVDTPQELVDAVRGILERGGRTGHQ